MEIVLISPRNAQDLTKNRWASTITWTLKMPKNSARKNGFTGGCMNLKNASSVTDAGIFVRFVSVRNAAWNTMT
jgi:hypothetical protein